MAMMHSPGFLAAVNGAKTRIGEITISQYKQLVASGQPFTLVDVREDTEWTAGRAQGAIHLGKGVIERDVEATIPDKEERVVLYCGGGFRSALAADSLQNMGYEHVESLAGGWKAWNDAGLPVER